MSIERDRLIDHLLRELPGEEAREIEERLGRDAEARAEHEHLALTIALVREAATEGWESPPARPVLRRMLYPALAAAAVLLVAVGVFLANGAGVEPRRIYEPDGTFGYLRPEEVDSAGAVRRPSTADTYVLRSGGAEVAALGSDRFYPLDEGDEILPDSEINSPADAGVRIDMPHGGILFLGPLSTVRLRPREDGETALRLMDGSACTVAGSRPIHLAVEGGDLLLIQRSGATMLRRPPSEAVCLRGEVHLRLAGGELFRIPAGERLPAACAHEPKTVPLAEEVHTNLDWYCQLIYANCRCESVVWARPGLSEPLEAGPETLLYVHVVPEADGRFRLAYGAAAREFEVAAGVPLELRLRLADLGPGPRLSVDPAGGVRVARLFEAKPLD